MTNDEYLIAARATDIDDYSKVLIRLHLPRTLMVLHALMGITTECGELMDQLKKHLIYGKELDGINIMEEDGDLRWYLSLLEFACGYSADTAQEKNIEKLRARYPNKFNEVSALMRDLTKERGILEA